MTEQQREAFESWYNEEYVRPIIPADRTEGGYQHPDAQAAWDAWQAALTHAEGEAVPVAVLIREIGEDAWFDHCPVPPNSPEHAAAVRAPELDDCVVYAHPAPRVTVPEEVAQALAGMMAIVRDSRGVAGYHLNGDIAEWDEFDEVAAAEVALAETPTAPAGEPVVFPEPQEATTIEEYVGEYEYTDGEGHNYSPTETERALILDAIHGIPDHLLQPPKPAQQPVSDSDGSSNSSRALLDQIIEQLEGGFVACSSCGDQEDTATLDVMSDLLRLRFLLADAGNRAAPDEREIAAKALDRHVAHLQAMGERDARNNDHEGLQTWEGAVYFARQEAARLRAGKGDE